MVLVNMFAYLHVLLTGWTRRWHLTHWSVTYPGRWVTVSHRCTHTVTRAVAHCNTTSSTQTTKSSQTPLTRNCLRVQKQYSNWGRADGASFGQTLPQSWAYAFEISAVIIVVVGTTPDSRYTLVISTKHLVMFPLSPFICLLSFTDSKLDFWSWLEEQNCWSIKISLRVKSS